MSILFIFQPYIAAFFKNICISFPRFTLAHRTTFCGGLGIYIRLFSKEVVETWRWSL